MSQEDKILKIENNQLWINSRSGVVKDGSKDPSYNIPETADTSALKPVITDFFRGDNGLIVEGRRIFGSRVLLGVPGNQGVAIPSQFISYIDSQTMKISNVGNFKFGSFSVSIHNEYGNDSASISVDSNVYPDPVPPTPPTPPVPPVLLESFEDFAVGELLGSGVYGTWSSFIVPSVQVQNAMARTGSKGIALGLSPELSESESPDFRNLALLYPDDVGTSAWEIEYYFKSAPFGTEVGEFPGVVGNGAGVIFFMPIFFDNGEGSPFAFSPAIQIAFATSEITLMIGAPGEAAAWTAVVNPDMGDIFDGEWHKVTWKVTFGSPSTIDFWIDDTWGTDDISGSNVTLENITGVGFCLLAQGQEGGSEFDSDIYMDDLTLTVT